METPAAIPKSHGFEELISFTVQEVHGMWLTIWVKKQKLYWTLNGIMLGRAKLLFRRWCLRRIPQELWHVRPGFPGRQRAIHLWKVHNGQKLAQEHFQSPRSPSILPKVPWARRHSVGCIELPAVYPQLPMLNKCLRTWVSRQDWVLALLNWEWAPLGINISSWIMHFFALWFSSKVFPIYSSCLHGCS